jgi:hypothetical protein
VPALTGLARARALLGERARAEAGFRAAIELAREALPPGHPDLATALAGLASALGAADRAEACALASEARAIRAAAYPPGDPRTAEAERLLADCG